MQKESLLTSTLSFSPLLFNTIANYLTGICADDGDKYVMHEDFKKEPNHISLQDFVQRIYKNSRCSSSCLIISCMFLDKIKKNNPQLIFAESNIRRLYLVGTMLAAKAYEDHVFLNTEWVLISDKIFSIEIINRMEREFLCLLNFSLLFSPSEYASFCTFLARKYQRNSESSNTNINIILTSPFNKPMPVSQLKSVETPISPSVGKASTPATVISPPTSSVGFFPSSSSSTPFSSNTSSFSSSSAISSSVPSSYTPTFDVSIKTSFITPASVSSSFSYPSSSASTSCSSMSFFPSCSNTHTTPSFSSTTPSSSASTFKFVPIPLKTALVSK